jgi:hypothetical protein
MGSKYNSELKSLKLAIVLLKRVGSHILIYDFRVACVCWCLRLAA